MPEYLQKNSKRINPSSCQMLKSLTVYSAQLHEYKGKIYICFTQTSEYLTFPLKKTFEILVYYLKIYTFTHRK